MWRIDSVFYIGLVSLAGALIAGHRGHWVLWRLACVWLAPTLGWVASLYGGDYFDRKLDALAKPGRPIPSGRMSPTTAFGGMIFNIVAGTAIAVILNPLNLVLVLLSVVMGVLYARVLKARGLAGNLIRGGPTAAAFLLGTLAVRTLPPWPLSLLALVFWMHDSASNLVGAICDRDGDRLGGYQTVPVRRGDAGALRRLAVLDLLWITSALASSVLLPGPADLRAYFAFLIIAIGGTAACFRMLSLAPRPVTRLHALRAHEVLVFGRLALAAGYVAAAIGLRPTLVILAPSLICTLCGRLVMRQRDHVRLRGRWFKNYPSS